jgi:hypothetical protein
MAANLEKTTFLPPGRNTVQKSVKIGSMVQELRDFENRKCLLRKQYRNCLDPDSNQDQDLRRVRCDPLHHRDQFHLLIICSSSTRADGWIRTSIILITRQAPFAVLNGKGRATSALTKSTQHEREESNPVKRFWRPPALPGAHSCKPTDGRPWAVFLSGGRSSC